MNGNDNNEKAKKEGGCKISWGRFPPCTPNVNVWRGGIDAEELLGIRRGEWSYDRLVEWAEAEDKALQTLYKQRDYVVRGQPDRKAIDRLCVEMIEEWLEV